MLRTSSVGEMDRISRLAGDPIEEQTFGPETVPPFLRADREEPLTPLDFGEDTPIKGLNPKTLMGQRKVPCLSVVPPTALLYLGMAMRYGAYESPRTDGSHGYGPYNWRDQPVEASTYVDAAMRHIMQFWDGEDIDPSSGAPHLAHALATLAVLVDAIENGTCADDRPRVRKNVASMILDREKKTV